jgi:hypothetical protein
MAAITLAIESGWLKGHAVRRAAKEYQCEYWRGSEGRCAHKILRGDYYVEGELRGGGSPYAMKRYCSHCVPEINQSLALRDARVFGAQAAFFTANGNTITAANSAHDAAHFAFKGRPDLR